MMTALVPAAPERKRILRELLARPEPWPVAHRNVYRQMIEAEYFEVAVRLAMILCAKPWKRICSPHVYWKEYPHRGPSR